MMPLFNTSLGGSTPKTLVTPDGVTDSIAIEKVDGKIVKPSIHSPAMAVLILLAHQQLLSI